METKKIQDGAFFLSFVVIRYEQREVQSMAFGNNIKKLREEKKSDSTAACGEIVCIKTDNLQMGKRLKMPGFDHSKKIGT